jgi:hypothetical protein
VTAGRPRQEKHKVLPPQDLRPVTSCLRGLSLSVLADSDAAAALLCLHDCHRWPQHIRLPL